MRYFYVNGRFLTQNLTGVQRFATEIIRRLDGIVAASPDEMWTILVPPTQRQLPRLRNLRLKTVGFGHGHVWEQLSLPFAAADGVLVNLCNAAPILHSRQIVVIHDALVYRYPEYLSLKYQAVHRLLGWALSRRARIGTVSPFSARELSEVLRLSLSEISIFPNGGDHILSSIPDAAIHAKLGIEGKRYFLFLSSMAPHKNLKTALAAFAEIGDPNLHFVVVGGVNGSVFGKMETSVAAGVVIPGRLSDDEITALYRGASALLFPSVYEGFGIPALEAALLGCPVISADIPPVRDLLGPNADFFPALDVEAMARVMRAVLDRTPAETALRIVDAQDRVASFTWKSSAEALHETCLALHPA